ncbi:hypothetical protein BJX61DRAFT_129444 [Aspergillus egyptiacus]|nr:hypothetical protein BJX61DRAFT_129444 [Aspergillus egyptiacus]
MVNMNQGADSLCRNRGWLKLEARVIEIYIHLPYQYPAIFTVLISMTLLKQQISFNRAVQSSSFLSVSLCNAARASKQQDQLGEANPRYGRTSTPSEAGRLCGRAGSAVSLPPFWKYSTPRRDFGRHFPLQNTGLPLSSGRENGTFSHSTVLL